MHDESITCLPIGKDGAPQTFHKKSPVLPPPSPAFKKEKIDTLVHALEQIRKERFFLEEPQYLLVSRLLYLERIEETSLLAREDIAPPPDFNNNI